MSMKILLVDDDKDNADSMAWALHAERSVQLTPGGVKAEKLIPSDLVIHVAYSRRAAMKVVLDGFFPHAVLVDMFLSGDPRGGAALVKDLRAVKFRDNLGVVIVTGYDLSDPTDLPEGTIIIKKPPEPRDVLDALEEVAERSSDHLPKMGNNK